MCWIGLAGKGLSQIADRPPSRWLVGRRCGRVPDGSCLERAGRRDTVGRAGVVQGRGLRRRVRAMARYVLLTAAGRDRPGIVAAVSGVLFEKGCNIEDSTMARLGGEFAIMLMVRLSEGLTREGLEADLGPIGQRFGLMMQLSDVPAERAVESGPATPRYIVHVYGADKKGIVAGVTRHLADRGANIANLTTQVIRHEQPLYVMLIEVELPADLDPGQLGEELAELGGRIDVEITVRPKDDARF